MPRFDGREWNEIRKISIELDIVPNAAGSAIFKFGETWALAIVDGPKPGKMSAGFEEGLLRVRYDMLPFSVPERKKPGQGRREIELSEIIQRALKPAIFLDELHGSIIDVYVQILNADAGTRTAGINAASLALALAGIPMKDLVIAVAVGKVGERIVIDLNKEEEDYDSEKLKNDPEKSKFIEYYGEGKATDIPVAILPSERKFTIIQLDGEIERENLKKALNLALEKSIEIREIMKKAILNKYESLKLPRI
ncbi:MAG: exosome complex exonuclease Rrp41 [Candidatus Nanoclepta minutus]|uniref:Exosome complex exonuclease Rrp41 n=1 Tax=Candidatus Nanoclepta minutus TaxID=1940235 RepID=A0A397WLY3_9ARCH|nr:MAG: exosome complex exonuclease Rrp41 [Candidatus Nanoclepta minutus]